MQAALGTVRKALLKGAGLVVLILLFFMGHARSSMLVAVQLPLAALATCFAMRWIGLSANLMTLSGLATVMLADGAIFVVENAARMMDKDRPLEVHLVWLVRATTSEVPRLIVFGIVLIFVVGST